MDSLTAKTTIETAGGLVWESPQGWKATVPGSATIYTRDDEGLIELARTLKANEAIGVGQSIREARMAKGISMRQLARAAGVLPSFLSHVEIGYVDASPETFARIQDALKGVPNGQ